MKPLEKPVWSDGFVLNTQIIRKHNAEHIGLWLVTPNGCEYVITPPQNPTLFIRQHDSQKVINQISDINLIDSHLKTFEHEPICVVKANTQASMNTFKHLCRKQSVTLYEEDIKLADRFLMERFIYGSVCFQTQPSLRLKPGNYKPKLSYLVIDIECDEQGRLFSIACDDGQEGWVWMIDAQNKDLSETNFLYTHVDDERDLLKAWSAFISSYNPDVLLGWNVKQFDCRLLQERAKALAVELRLGRDGTCMTVKQGNNDQYWVDIAGRAVVDGIESLKTMTFQFANYTLDHVAQQILGKRKLVHEIDQLQAIKHMFLNDKPALARYNWQDCRLVSDIIKKTKLIDFLVLRTCMTGLPISRPGGSVAAFINTYLPHVHRAGYVSPNRPLDGGLASPGGYVMSSKPGMYKHVLVLDFKSLYPSIMRTFLIDPVGLVEGLKEKNKSATISGFKAALFSRTTHFLPKIIDDLWKQRDIAKREGDEARSRAIKIIMNSFYGVLGSGGCPFYDTRLASSITLRGHEIMQITKEWIEELGFQVIYGDTDSTFVWVENCESDQHANQTGKTLAAQINAKWSQYIKDEYATPCYLELEFETHFERFFMPTIRHSELGSKKRYAGLTGEFHGNSLVFKGLETVRSDWTALAKQFQTSLYRMIFTNQEVQQYIADIVKQTFAGEHDAHLIYHRKLRKPVDAYTKTRPPHVKAAILANKTALAENRPLPFPSKSTVSYVMSLNGPVAYQNGVALDYQHYIEKQIKPIADSILPHIGLCFDHIIDQQLRLF